MVGGCCDDHSGFWNITCYGQNDRIRDGVASRRSRAADGLFSARINTAAAAVVGSGPGTNVPRVSALGIACWVAGCVCRRRHGCTTLSLAPPCLSARSTGGNSESSVIAHQDQ